MSVVSVRARSFILALFIRDDGDRFLLGDKGFDFKDSQLHFSANNIENDEVAKQGVDGVMLAGQVRRASVQGFDGYVGDGTTLKEEVEQMRRDFIAFFANGHHFRVIYIDCNRNAWQRKGGYLVDAPEVKELWQIHPEYHVGLNFEDVNYYEYDENAEGEEILSNIISVPISSDIEGGLVWDENGAVSEPAEIEYDTETATASGTNISIADAAAAPLSSFSISGNTVQNGTPTPDAPVAVQTVTGENVVKISDGQGAEQSYEVNLGKNLFDIAAASDVWINTSGAARPNAYWKNSDFIKVEPNTTYTLSGSKIEGGWPTLQFQYHEYSSDNESSYINQYREVNDVNSITFTTHTGCNYIRVGYRWDALENIQLELGPTATSYAAYFEPIELCKIGDYQDSIYKSDGKWYVHKEIGEVTLDGSESWVRASANSGYRFWTGKATDIKVATDAVLKANRLGVAQGDTWDNYGISGSYTPTRIYIRNVAFNDMTVEQLQAWLSTHNIIAYYALATPTDTEITNEALVAQLEAVLGGSTYAGTNNITTAISAGNARGELEITYYTKYDAKVVGGGYVWEAGGSGGPTIVTNESISAVSPVWTVFGPALNPMLENTTTGEQIQYAGMIGERNTLVVDMGEQTARLDGLNVISNIVGEYLTLAPGSNTLLFSAEGDAPASEIGWSEIVG